MRHLLSASIAVLALAGCATTRPPTQVSDACSILNEKRAWRSGLRDAAHQWTVSPGLILAFIQQESGFRADAKPPRGDGFLFIPGARPSSAEGYAQALDGTWNDYRAATGNGGAKRSRFTDAADFVGWYVNRSNEVAQIPLSDVQAHYLAYHEGPAGYRRGTWRSKAWLLNVSNKVAANAARYDNQLARCDGVRLATRTP
jgi:hypothetical protein